VIFSSQQRNRGDAFPVLVASAAKRKRAEVKLKDLSPSQKAEFEAAKQNEIDQWFAIETVPKILRHKIPENKISNGRWVLTCNKSVQSMQQKNGKPQKRR
jgi:hypothetical protein